MRCYPMLYVLSVIFDDFPLSAVLPEDDVAERVGGGEGVHARYLKPFDARLLTEQRAKGMKIVSLENGCVAGGFGEAIGADVKFGWPDRFIPHGAPAELEQRYGLDVDSIVSTLQRTLTTNN